MAHTICRLQSEIKILQKELKDSAYQEEINQKIADLENRCKKGYCKQDIYDEKLYDLQALMDETLIDLENEKKRLKQRLCIEQDENAKKNECIKRFAEQIESLKCENSELKAKMEARNKQMIALESKECSDFTEMDELIRTLQIQKCELKNLCSNLKEELEKEQNRERILETKIEELKDALECKTQEVCKIRMFK